MRFHILSDLHLETAAYELSCGPSHDAVILAGDLHGCAPAALRWLAAFRARTGDIPIVYVPGNHEYYGGVYQHIHAVLQQGQALPHVHVLAPGEVVLGGQTPGRRVRVLGATLWTDFLLPVQTRAGREVDPERALRQANQCMDDFYRIALAVDERDNVLPEPAAGSRLERSFHAQDCRALHVQQRSWLEQRLAQPFEGPTVVVTHHAPCARSVAKAFQGDWLSPAFTSELPGALFEVPSLWVHGHTHTAFDYRVGTCRVVCNPRGYASHARGSQTPGFDPNLVIEVG